MIRQIRNVGDEFSLVADAQVSIFDHGLTVGDGVKATGQSGTMHALTTSPWYESGTPITAAIRTPACVYSTPSTSDG